MSGDKEARFNDPSCGNLLSLQYAKGMSSERGKGGDEDWDDLLEGKEKVPGLSPDMARALLSMNPKLREEGKNTAWMVHSSQQAQQSGAKGEKPKPPPSNVTVQTKPGADVFGVLDELKKHMEQETQRIDLEKRRLDDERRKLDEQMKKLNGQLLDQLCDWLLAKDPELLSPLTQQALSERKAFLDRLGFSAKQYSERKRRKP